ncbi:tRNA(Ile)-lysidine synthase [Fistulifera solaris]|uniref:tRNA(Ile)-lysidine synthetase n=1 Tax=Fistulifera solaris TaxID=1519565 RepID=A0A1Z5KF31_FISSO|nr:tRNA(Ile)-lysidine synthase [Fistulifera solaris]|eukprot:GAX24903.1 tRNA(Ile)-lysidine synthase [Fistulifera solaris]
MALMMGFRRQHLLYVSAFVTKINPLRKTSITLRRNSLQSHHRQMRTVSSFVDVPSEMKRSFCLDILPRVSNRQNNTTIVLLAGISGGCDSVALFHALQDIQQKDDSIPGSWTFVQNSYSITFLLHAIHFDHQQRGENSNADREFVEALCQQYNVPCTTVFWNDDHQSHESFSQEKARNWRRNHMRRRLQKLIADGNATGFIVTAHHLDDSNETLLLKLLRGSHLTKLAGMAPIVTDEMNDNLYWVRPLLSLSKNQLIAYLQDNGYVWREDESNEKDIYLRNRVRNELIPLMKDVMGGDVAFQKRLDSMEAQSQKLRCDLAAKVALFFQENIHQDTACPSRTILHIPKDTDHLDLVFEEALYDWVANGCTNHQCTYEQLQRLIRQITDYPQRRKWSLNIGGGWDVQREGDILRIVESILPLDSVDRGHATQSVEIAVTLPEDWKSDSAHLQVQVPKEKFSKQIKFISTTSSYDDNLLITPPWRRGRSPLNLKEFLRGQKVALHNRKHAPVILMVDESECPPTLVAVFVDSKGEWVLDYQFCPKRYSDDREIGVNQRWLRFPKQLPN